MDNFDLKKYLAEGKLHENIEIRDSLPLTIVDVDDVFKDQVVRWAEGNYYFDFDDLEDGSEPGSKIDNFTLIPDSYEDDDYVKDYKIMKDYLVKNKTYDLKQDPKEGIFSYPVKFSLEGDGKTIRADIYFSPEYMKAIDKEDL